MNNTKHIKKSAIQYMLPLIAILVCSTININAQTDTQVLTNWYHYIDSRNALYHHLAKDAYDYLNARKENVSTLKTVAQWEIRKPIIEHTIMELMGNFPEKTPLNSKVTNVLEREDFRIEKIIYESQPGFYVTAALFIPENLKEKAPAILFCSGHKDEAYRKDFNQHVIINLVKKGFVVLAFDPIGQGERLQYCNPETNRSMIGWANLEHSYPSVQVSLLGQSIIRYFVWDGIRGIDYLISRKEVDPNRIGVHGISGGGLQTTYIAALDNRVAAAAPACYITSYSRLYESIGIQDGEQNLYLGVKKGIDHADFLELRAPKPTLIMTNTNDFFSIQGARETFDEVKQVYTTYNKPENLSIVEDDFGHGYTKKNREALYSFFQKHLNNPGIPNDTEVELFTMQELQNTSTGQTATSLNGLTVFDLNQNESVTHIEKLNESRKNLAEHLSKIPENAKIRSGYKQPTSTNKPVFTGRLLKDGKYSIEKYFVKSEGEYVIPYLLFLPEQPVDKAAIVLYPKGKASVTKHSQTINMLINEGVTVLVPDLIGIGELGGSDYVGDALINNTNYNITYMGLLTGKSIVGIQATDVTRLVEILKTNHGIKEIYGIAHEEMGPTLLHSAACSSSLSGVALIRPYSSYQTLLNSRFYLSKFVHSLVPGALTAYDLPDLAASLAPAKLLISGITDANGKITDIENNTDFNVVREAYTLLQANDKLKIVQPKTLDNVEIMIKEWINPE